MGHLTTWLLLILFSGALSATEYDVSPIGNDANSGLIGSPFRQIRQALTVVQPADVILVEDGQYAGFTISGLNGTSTAPITIQAAGSGAQVMVTTDRSDNRDTIFISLCSHIIIDGLTSFNANRAAVRIDQSSDITIRNATFGNNAVWGIFTDFSDDTVLQNNECYGSVQQHGIYVSNSSQRPIISLNRVHDNHDSGIQINADLTAGPPGLTSGALIERNTLWNNGVGGGSTINLDGVQDSIVRNNLLYECHATGIVNYMGFGAAGPVGMQILNNTVDIAADGRWGLVMYSTAGSNLVRDNLFSNENASNGALNYLSPSDAMNTDSANNIFCGASNVTDDGESSQISMSAWQSGGNEPRSIVSSLASLVIGNLDYHLLVDSPAIGAGAADGVTDDLDGDSRPPGGPIDVGAYQHPSGSTTASTTTGSTVGTTTGAATAGGGGSATGSASTTASTTSGTGQGSASATTGGTAGTGASVPVTSSPGSGGSSGGGCGLGAGGALGILLVVSLARRRHLPGAVAVSGVPGAGLEAMPPEIGMDEDPASERGHSQGQGERMGPRIHTVFSHHRTHPANIPTVIM
jgi:parallel beta-helix repeat protein